MKICLNNKAYHKNLDLSRVCGNGPSFKQIWLNSEDTCLYNFITIFSSFLTNALVLGWIW